MKTLTSFRVIAFAITFIFVPGVGSSNPKIPSSVKDRFEEIVVKLVEESNIPGIAIGVVDRSVGDFTLTIGSTQIDGGTPVNSKTVYGLASVSKTFGSASAAVAVDQGLLEWDEPITKRILPNFKLLDPVATERVSLVELLSHQTGMPRHDLVWAGFTGSRAELIDRLQYLPPSAPFREFAQYTNLMVTLAAWSIGKASESEWEEYTQNHLLNQLDMDQTFLSVKALKDHKNLALPHSLGKVMALEDRDVVGPAGAIYSNVEDMSKWTKLFLNKGKFKNNVIITEESIRMLTTKQVETDLLGLHHNVDSKLLGSEAYALGWFVQKVNQEESIHHAGNVPGYSAHIWLIPDSGRGVVVLTNTDSLLPQYLPLIYFDLVNGGDGSFWVDRLKSPKKGSAPKKSISRPLIADQAIYTGDYFHPGYGKISIRAGEQENDLLLIHPAFQSFFGHWVNHIFYPVTNGDEIVLDFQISFELGSDGKVAVLRLPLEPAVPPMEFVPLVKDF